MSFIFEQRLSDSPYVEAIWRTQSVGGGSFISSAASHWEMVVTKQEGKVTLSIRGPETKASPAPIPEDAEFLGIIFKRGAFMPHLPKSALVNRAVNFTGAPGSSFSLYGATMQFPSFENADTFVERLIRTELLQQDNVIDDVLRGQTLYLSMRSIQRRFLYVTGLTHKAIQQIERARQAMTLLQSGVPIPDAAYQTGYFDQPHLTKSLKLFVGQTPAEILKSNQDK